MTGLVASTHSHDGACCLPGAHGSLILTVGRFSVHTNPFGSVFWVRLDRVAPRSGIR